MYTCYLNGRLYGSGSLEYMHELFYDYVVTSQMYNHEVCSFVIRKENIVERDRPGKKYEKKLEVVEAIQLTGTHSNFKNLQEFIGSNIRLRKLTKQCGQTDSVTLFENGTSSVVLVGSYFIRDRDGEIKVCSEDWFNNNYNRKN